MTKEEYHEYQKKYYAEHKEYFQWYRQKHRARINAQKRKRYRENAEWRAKDLARRRELYRKKTRGESEVSE